MKVTNTCLRKQSYLSELNNCQVMKCFILGDNFIVTLRQPIPHNSYFYILIGI